MTPDAAIAALDRALAVAGEPVTLRRVAGTQLVPFDCENIPAVVRGYAADELAGPVIKQGDSRVILSPTEMQRRQWCWPPRANDKCIVRGKVRNVEEAAPLYMGGSLVRMELRVRG